MRKKFLEYSLWGCVLLLFHKDCHAQSFGDQFKSFLDEMSTNITLLADQAYRGTDVSNNRTWIQQHFFDNADVFDACTNQHIKDFIAIKLPYLQTQFEYVGYKFELIQIELGNRAAVVKQTIQVNQSVVYSGKCNIKFEIVENEFKVERISNVFTEKNNLPTSFCTPIQTKRNWVTPVLLTTTGLGAIGGSFYFQSQETQFYDAYKRNLSETVYTKANDAHHLKLGLRYTGIAVVAAGVTTWLLAKRKPAKRNPSFSTLWVSPMEGGLTLKYRF